MLSKMAGRFAPRPSAGPHKLRESLPLVIFIRNRLKYALTYAESKWILRERQVLVDGKVRTDLTYPAGLMDVLSIPQTNENYRLLYDVKGRFELVPLSAEEAQFKLCKVKRQSTSLKNVPVIVTHDARTIRYPDPNIHTLDTIKIDIKTGKIVDHIKFDNGVQVMITGGRNTGRVGVVVHREKHPGNFDIVHVKDGAGLEFATRLGNVFVIGKGAGSKPWISLPKGNGQKLTVAEERDQRLAKK